VVEGVRNAPTAGVAEAERRKRGRRAAGAAAALRASDTCLPAGAAGQLSFVPSPDGLTRGGSSGGGGAGRRQQHFQRAGSHEFPPMPSGEGSGARACLLPGSRIAASTCRRHLTQAIATPYTGWDADGPHALAGRAFASGLASVQRKSTGGAGAKYRVRFFLCLLSMLVSSAMLPGEGPLRRPGRACTRAGGHVPQVPPGAAARLAAAAQHPRRPGDVISLPVLG
jgi:hypothetical protein